ncbi:MAG: hypothetical protein VX589_08625 [Myxococcota bacterium]|nr:hypothetical protein [Myxococcota bacterium]
MKGLRLVSAPAGRSDQSPCVRHEVGRRAGGLNDRDGRTRPCLNGLLGTWDPCIDEDRCTEYTTGDSPCGFGGHRMCIPLNGRMIGSPIRLDQPSLA